MHQPLTHSFIHISPPSCLPHSSAPLSRRLTIKAKCPMELRNFPLDKQSCPLVISSCEWPVVVSYVAIRCSSLFSAVFFFFHIVYYWVCVSYSVIVFTSVSSCIDSWIQAVLLLLVYLLFFFFFNVLFIDYCELAYHILLFFKCFATHWFVAQAILSCVSLCQHWRQQELWRGTSGGHLILLHCIGSYTGGDAAQRWRQTSMCGKRKDY